MMLCGRMRIEPAVRLCARAPHEELMPVNGQHSHCPPALSFPSLAHQWCLFQQRILLTEDITTATVNRYPWEGSGTLNLGKPQRRSTKVSRALSTPLPCCCVLAHNPLGEYQTSDPSKPG